MKLRKTMIAAGLGLMIGTGYSLNAAACHDDVVGTYLTTINQGTDFATQSIISFAANPTSPLGTDQVFVSDSGQDSFAQNAQFVAPFGTSQGIWNCVDTFSPNGAPLIEITATLIDFSAPGLATNPAEPKGRKKIVRTTYTLTYNPSATAGVVLASGAVLGPNQFDGAIDLCRWPIRYDNDRQSIRRACPTTFSSANRVTDIPVHAYKMVTFFSANGNPL